MGAMEDQNSQERSDQEMNAAYHHGLQTSLIFSKYCILAASVDPKFINDLVEAGQELTRHGGITFPLPKFVRLFELVKDKISSLGSFSLRPPVAMELHHWEPEDELVGSEITDRPRGNLVTFGYLFLQIVTCFNNGSILQNGDEIVDVTDDLQEECEAFHEALLSTNGNFEYPGTDDDIVNLWQRGPSDVSNVSSIAATGEPDPKTRKTQDKDI